MSERSILFVCLGNICRSPMAHGIFLGLAEERGVSDRLVIDSCGTGHWHVGERADPRTREVLARHDLAYDHRARQFAGREDLDRFDRILCMDRKNLRDVLKSAEDHHRDKIDLALAPTTGGDVPDPYYGGDDGFDRVYAMLDESLRVWMDRLLEPR